MADLTDLDPLWLLLSLIPSGIGFVLFRFGKKEVRWPHLAAGLALMVYPLFAPTVTTLVGGGALIGAGFWLALRVEG